MKKNKLYAPIPVQQVVANIIRRQNTGQKIYFVTVTLKEEVHAQALGFTNVIYNFTVGSDETLMKQKVIEYYKNKHVFVNDCFFRLCEKQDVKSYCFPERMILQ